MSECRLVCKSQLLSCMPATNIWNLIFQIIAWRKMRQWVQIYKICTGSICRKLQNWWKKSRSQRLEKYYIYGLEDSILSRSQFLPTLYIYRFNAILIKISANYFVNINEVTQMFIWKDKWLWIINKIIKRNRGTHTICFQDFL